MEFRKTLSSVILALLLLTEVQTGVIPVFQPIIGKTSAATNALGPASYTPVSPDSQTNANGNPVTRPGGGTLNCPSGQVVTSVAYVGIQAGNDSTDGITIACSPINQDGTLGSPGAYLSNADFNNNPRYPSDRVEPNCEGNNAVATVYWADLESNASGGREDAMDGEGIGCRPISCDGIGNTEVETHQPGDMLPHGSQVPTTIQSLSCPDGSVAVGIVYDSFGSQVSSDPDAIDSVVKLNCAPVGNSFCPLPTADLTIQKFGPSTIQRGNVISYQLNAFNAGPADASNVVITDQIPAGLTFNAGQSSSNCSQNGSNILCNGFDLAAGQSSTFTIAFNVPTVNNCSQTTIQNRASISSSTTESSTSNNQSQTVTTTVTCPVINADLSITKSGPSSVLRGNVASYQVNVFNGGPATANNVVVTDPIPAGLTWNSSQTSGGCSQNGSNIVCNAGTMAAGQSASFTISFNVPSVNNCSQTTVQNTATVTSSTTDPNNSNNQSQTVQTTVTCPQVFVCSDGLDNDGDGLIDFPQDPGCLSPTDNDEFNAPQADLSITKSGPSSVQRGNVVSYQLNAFNAGPNTASNVTIADPIPAGLTFNASQSSGNCVQNGSNILCNNLTLTSGQSATVTVAFTVSSSFTCNGVINNAASVSTSATDPNPNNNQSQTVQTTVTCPVVNADLSITKSGPSSVLRGNVVSYQVNVFNSGPATANNVVVTDAIPAGLTWNSSQTSGGCSQNGSNIVCNVGTLGAGQSSTLTISFNVPSVNNCSQTTVQNTATVTSSTTDPNSSNNQSQTVQTTVTCPQVFVCSDGLDNDGDGLIDFPQDPGCLSPTDNDEFNAPQADLSITKSGPSSVQRGNVVSYQVSVFNSGPASASNVIVTDAIPAGLTWNSSQTSGGCSQNGSNIVCNVGTIGAGQSLTIQIGFNVPTVQNCSQTTINNTASVTSATSDPNSANNQSQTVQTTVTCPQVFVCSDGLDNDGDGLIDFPQDPGCSSPTDNDEFNAPQADLSIVKSGPSSVLRGGVVSYTLSAFNAGPNTANNVTIADPIPAGLTFNAGQSSGNCIQNGANILCNNLTLGSGQSVTVTIAFNVPTVSNCTTSTISNTASVSTSTTDPNSSNNQSQTVQTTLTCPQVFVCSDGLDNDGDGLIDFPQDPGCLSPTDNDEFNAPQADLSIVKSGPNSVLRGGVVSYTLSAFNAGPNTANNVTIADPIPAGLTFNAGQSSGNCIQNGANILCNNLTLGSSQSATVTIAFNVPTVSNCTQSTINNTASVSTSTTDPNSSNNQSQTVQTTVTCPVVNADLAIVKTGPSSVTRGGNATYTLSVVNNGPATATNVVVHDDISNLIAVNNGFTLTSATGAICQIINNGIEVACTIGSLGVGQPVTITLTFAVPTVQNCAQSTAINTATVTSDNDNNAANNQSQTTTLVQCPVVNTADLSIVKVGPQTAERGTTVSYTIIASNNGPSAAVSTTVIDQIPAGLTFASFSASPGTVCSANGSQVQCTLGTVPSNSSQSFTLVFNATLPQTCTQGTVTNTATIQSSVTDPSSTNNTSSFQTTLTCPQAASADLTVSKIGPSQLLQGTQITYSLIATNFGPSAATNVIIRDPVPAGLTFVSSSGASCAIVSGELQCTIASIPSGQSSALITATFQTAAPAQNCTQTTLTNTANVTSSVTDPNSGNNSSTAQTTLTCPAPLTADLSIQKSGPSTTLQGSVVQYTLIATNAGPGTATNVTIADPIPAGLTFNAGQSSSNCIQNGANILCNNITLTSGQSTSPILVAFNVPASYTCNGVINNQASVSTSATDPNPSNNQSQTVTTTATCPVQTTDLWITKSGPSSVLRGQTLAYTLSVSNGGPSLTPANIKVVDPIPAGQNLTFNAGASSGTCSQSGSSIVCLATLGPSSSTNFVIAFNVPTVAQCNTATVQNTATVTSQIQDSNPSNNTSGTVTTSLLCPTVNTADVTISKTGTQTAVRGNAVSYTLVASNIGTATATGVVVTDVIPSELTYVSFSAPTGVTCAVVNTTNVECTVGTLNPNASVTIILNFTAKTIASCTQNAIVTNTVTIERSNQEYMFPHNWSSATTILTCPTTQIADMQVVLTGPSSVSRGSNAVYTAAITNNGPNSAQAASVQIPVPSGMTYVSSSGATCTLAGSTLTCALGTMTSGQNLSVVLTFSVPTISNCTQQTTQAVATVSSTTSDSNTANNTSQVNTTLTCVDANLSISKTDNRSSATVGDTLHYTIVITNSTSTTATNVTVTDTVPYGLTILTVSDGATINGQNVTWNNLTINGNSSRTITLNAQVRSDISNNTVLHNTATVNGQNASDDTTVTRDTSIYTPPYYPPYEPPRYPPYFPPTPPTYYPPVVTPPTYYPPVILPETGTEDNNFYTSPTDSTHLTVVKPGTQNGTQENGFGALFITTLLTILAAGSAAASKLLGLGGL